MRLRVTGSTMRQADRQVTPFAPIAASPQEKFLNPQVGFQRADAWGASVATLWICGDATEPVADGAIQPTSPTLTTAASVHRREDMLTDLSPPESFCVSEKTQFREGIPIGM